MVSNGLAGETVGLACGMHGRRGMKEERCTDAGMPAGSSFPFSSWSVDYVWDVEVESVRGDNPLHAKEDDCISVVKPD